MSETRDWTVADLEAAIHKLASDPPENAVDDLTRLANRAIVDLHVVARGEAAKRKGSEDWGQWARLANAVRSGVLQIAAIKDALKGIKTEPSDRANPQ